MSLTGDRLEELVLEIGSLRAELEKRPRLVWGVVTSTSPLLVRIDGDSSSTAAAGSASGAPPVGTRVYCSLQNGRLTVLSSPGTSGPPAPADPTPTGTITAFGGETAPEGWLPCDGVAHRISNYPDLYAVIGTTYGSSFSSFRVPDLRGRVPAGLHTGQTEFNALGKTGGAATHTLTVGEMPPHNHGGESGDSAVDGAFSNADGTGTPSTSRIRHGNDDTARYNSTINGSRHTHSIPSSGGGEAHNNLQPYLVVNFIIKT